MNRRPRIGWLCNSAIGTSETFLVDNLRLLQDFAEVNAFSGNRHATGGHPDVTALDFDDIPQKLHHIIRRKLSGQDVRTLAKRRRCREQLATQLKEFKPDVLWIEFGTTAHIASDLLAELKIPYIIAVHGFDITREFRDPWYAEEFARLANASHAVVCASHHTRNLCMTAGVHGDRCHVIRLPLDGQRFTPSPDAQPHPASFVHLGRLVEKKGPLQTVMAFEKVLEQIPEARLTLIGEGPLRDVIEGHIQKSGTGESIRLTGALKQDEALNIVRQHAVFCQHSVTGKDGDQEGFALSPAEAALMEMPVVSTLHNGIPEHVQDGTTGLLVREWDIDGMAKAMLELASNPEKAIALGKAGRKNILELCAPGQRKTALKSLVSSAS